MAILLPGSRTFRASNVSVGPNDASEITLIDQQLPAFGLNSGVRCTVKGDLLSNSAASRTGTLRVYAAGTKIFDGVTGALTQTGARRALWLEMLFANYGATNTNELDGEFSLGAGANPTTGISGLGSGIALAAFGSGPVAIDTSVPWNFKVTWQLSNAEALLDSRIKTVLLEVIP